MSSSHAYRHPIIGKRPNLEIRTHCWTENGFCPTRTCAADGAAATPDYRDSARVDPRNFTDPDGHDERVMAFGMQLARKIVSEPAMAEWAGADYMHEAHTRSTTLRAPRA